MSNFGTIISLGLYNPIFGQGTPREGSVSVPLLDNEMPEDGKALDPNTRLKDHPYLSSVLTTVKFACFNYYSDDPKKAKEYTDKRLDNWTLKDLQILVKNVKNNWGDNKVRRALSPVLFHIRVALLASQKDKTNLQIAGLAQGKVFLTQPDLYNIDHQIDIVPDKDINNKPAWEIPELVSIKQALKDAALNCGEKWTGEGWKVQEVINLYRRITKNINEEHYSYIKRYLLPIIPRLHVALASLGLLTEPKDKDFITYIAYAAKKKGILNQPAWSQGTLSTIKDKIKKAYKDWGQTWKGENWKTSNIITFYAYILANKERDDVKKHLLPLLPSLYAALVATVNLKLDPSAGSKDKKVRLFSQIYSEVRQAHLQKKEQDKKGFATFPESEVLKKQDIQNVLKLWASLKRQEIIKNYGADLAVIKGFEEALKASSHLGDLRKVRAHIWGLIANDPDKLDEQDGKLSKKQESNLYKLYKNSSSIRGTLDQAFNKLSKELQDKINNSARTRTLTYFLGRGVDSKLKAEVTKLRAEAGKLKGQVMARQSIIKYVENDKEIKGSHRENLLKKFKTQQSNLELKLKEKNEALKKAENDFIPSLGAKWGVVFGQQKVAILWSYIDKAVSYSNSACSSELRELASVYGEKINGIGGIKKVLDILSPEKPIELDLIYARYLAYKTVEKKDPPPLKEGEDADKYLQGYFEPVYAKTFLGSTLPVIYLATKDPKNTAKPDEDETYTYARFDMKSERGKALVSLLRLSDPKGELKDPVEAFATHLNGRFDQATWFQLFPNEKIQQFEQMRQMRERMNWKKLAEDPASLAKLAQTLGASGVNDPDFKFVLEILKGESRLVIKAPQKSGVLQNKTVEFFALKDNKLVKLNDKQQKIFEKLYLKFYSGQNVAEKNKLQHFLRAYFTDNAMFSPSIESLALELATKVIRGSNGKTDLVKELEKRDFRQTFFNALISVLRDYLNDSSIEPSDLKFGRIVEGWYIKNQNEIITALSQRVAMNAGEKKNSDDIPILDDKLQLLARVKELMTKMGDQLLRSGMLTGTANRDQIMNILNNAANLADRIVFYIKSDFVPLKLQLEKKGEENDPLNKTQYYVVDNFVLENMGTQVIRDPKMTVTEPRGFFDKWIKGTTGIDLTGRTESLESFTSHHQWMWQEPAAVVLLYFHKIVGGDMRAIDFKDGVLRVRHDITADDLRKIGAHLQTKKGDQKRRNTLYKAADIMEKNGIVFGNNIFKGMIEKRGVNIISPHPEIKEAIDYLRNWFDLIIRVTQPVFGSQYWEMLVGRLKKIPKSSLVSELWQAASTLPAPMVLRQLQMIDSDKTLALKEQLFPELFAYFRGGETGTKDINGAKYSRDFFEGLQGAGNWDGEMILRFADKYGALFKHSMFNMLVLGEESEKIASDPVGFLKGYAEELKGKKVKIGKDGTINIAHDPEDTPDDRKAKLLLQSALMLWKPGMQPKNYGSNSRGRVVRELISARDYLAGQLYGMDDTSPSHNYSLRVKSFLIKMGEYKYSKDFSLLDEKLTPDMVQFAGKYFQRFIKNMDAESMKDLLKIFKVSKEDMAKMADAMFNYKGGDINGLEYTDRNMSAVRRALGAYATNNLVEMAKALSDYNGRDINGPGDTDRNMSALRARRALVFFVRKIVPNYGAIVEGEGDVNFVNMPLMLEKHANDWNVKRIAFGSTSPTLNKGFSVSYKEQTLGDKALYHLGKIGQSIPHGMMKGLHFSLFIHPSIQLGLQAGAMVKLTRALKAGDTEQTKKVLKEWLAMRLQFFAFMYNPVALWRNAYNNFDQGNYVEGMVELTFGMHALNNIKRLAQSSLELTLKKAGIDLTKNTKGRRLLRWLSGQVNTQARVLSHNILEGMPEGNAKVHLKRTARRYLSTSKDMFFEPLTKFAQILNLKFGELHDFSKNVIYCAQDPDRIITIKNANVPVFGQKGKIIGYKNIPEISIRAGHLLYLYRQTLTPSVFSRALQGLMSFILGKGIMLKNIGRYTGRFNRMNRAIFPDTVALNLGKISPQQIQAFFQAAQMEAGQVRHKGFKHTSGNIFKRVGLTALEWFFATKTTTLLMHEVNNSLPLREQYFGRAATGWGFINKEVRKGRIGNKKNWRWLYKELRSTPKLKEQLDALVHMHRPDLKGKTDTRAFRRQGAAIVRAIAEKYSSDLAEFIYKKVHEVASRTLTEKELLAMDKNGGHLSTASFKKVYGDIKTRMNEMIASAEVANVNPQTLINNYLKQFTQQRSAANTPTPAAGMPAGVAAGHLNPPAEMFDLRASLNKSGIKFNLRGSFEGVSLPLQEQFSAALQKAGIKKVILGKGISFANGGEAALQAFITALNRDAGSLPKTLVVSLKEGRIMISGPWYNPKAYQLNTSSLMSFPAIPVDHKFTSLGMNGTSVTIEKQNILNGIREFKATAVERAGNLLASGQINRAQYDRMVQRINKGSEFDAVSLEKAAREMVELKKLDQEIKTLESGSSDPAQLSAKKTTLVARTRAFLQAHGSMIGILLAIDIARHYKDILKGNFKGAARGAAFTMGGYAVFVGAENGLVKLLKIGKGNAGLATASILPMLITAYEHKEHLVSNNTTSQLVAGLDVTIEGIKGIASFKAATTAARFVPGGPVVKGIAALAAAAVTYLGLSALEEVPGFKIWINKKLTKNQIKNLLSSSRLYGSLKVSVKDEGANPAFFNSKTIALADGTKVSEAQFTLAVLKMLESYGRLSTEKREAFVKKHGEFGQNIESVFATMQNISQINVGTFAGLNLEGLNAIVESVDKFSEEFGGNFRDVKVTVKKNVKKIEHPLGGVAGTITTYKVHVWARTAKKYAEETYDHQSINGNLQTLKEALIMQHSQVKDGDKEYFTLSLQDLIAHNIDIPFIHLERFPIVKAQLSNLLAMQGYDVYAPSGNGNASTNRVTTQSLEHAFFQYATHEYQRGLADKGYTIEEYNQSYGPLDFNTNPWLLYTTDAGKIELADRHERVTRLSDHKLEDMFALFNEQNPIYTHLANRNNNSADHAGIALYNIFEGNNPYSLFDPASMISYAQEPARGIAADQIPLLQHHVLFGDDLTANYFVLDTSLLKGLVRQSIFGQ